MRKNVLSLLLCALAALQGCNGVHSVAPVAASATASAATVQTGAAAHPSVSLHATERAALTIPVSAPGVPDAAFTNFEVAQVHPLDVTPDGTKLLSVNTANGTLEVFAINGSNLTLTSVIKVGVDPISVRAFSNTQAWVVNEISDSVSIVDIKNDVLTATLQTDDEPADVVFAGTPVRAYVSVAQARELMVFDPVVPTSTIARIPILGQQPRALATDGTNVYLGIFESGNGTTVLVGGVNDAPFETDIARDSRNPYGGVSPFPDIANGAKYTSLYGAGTANPPPPVSVIVRRAPVANAGLPEWLDENGKDWSAYINGSLAQLGNNANRAPGWDLIDRDVAIVNVATGAVTYQAGPLNIVMALAVNPTTHQVTEVGTDATNQIRYQPVLDGTFTRVLMGTFTAGSGQATASYDLNPHLTYQTSSIPINCATGSLACRTNSIGAPRGIALNPNNAKAYVTGMGSNGVIVINPNGAAAGGTTGVRNGLSYRPIPVGQGPTGIVVNVAGANPAGTYAYVLNRFDATISVLSLATETEVTRVALSYDPTPADIRAGRPMLYNTQINSGLGQLACASCHVDAKTDRLAWDLGDPTSALEVISGSNVASQNVLTGVNTNAPSSVTQHPMKGPLLTMTLTDRMQSPFLHWRGDRANLGAFATAFQALQGGDAPATTAQISQMQSFLATIHTPPNPYRTITNAYPTELAVPGPRGFPYRTGNAAIGDQEFEAGCRSCHLGQTGRGALFVENTFGISQFRNPPTWQNFYRRDGLWFTDATGSTTGFGFQQMGSFDSTQNSSRDDNLMAFMYSFNGSFPYTPAGLNPTNVAVDSHAAVGKQVTLNGSTVSDPLLAQLQALADTNAIDLVASGCVNNTATGFVYVGSGTYADDSGVAHSLAAMKAFAAAGSPITFSAVRRGTGYPIGIDENDDGTLDGVQGDTGTRVCSSGKYPNLLVNPSFETNSVGAGGWANVASLAGWTGSNGYVQIWKGLFGYAAVDGSSWMQVGASAALDSVSQTVTTATAGDALVLKFWYSARPGSPAVQNKFNVVWNGTVIDTLAPNGTNLTAPSWQLATYIVQATGKDTVAFAQAAGATGGTGALIDATSLVDAGASETSIVTPLANLAHGKTASASEIGHGSVAAAAGDGNIDGNFFDGSVADTTGNAAQDYWEVDLGAVNTIQTVNLFNRTDCCATRLNNFYVLVAQSSMDGQSLAQLLANPAVTQKYVATTGFVAANMPQEYTVGIGGVQGRFVRIQLAGTSELALAEVQVMGWPLGAK